MLNKSNPTETRRTLLLRLDKVLAEQETAGKLTALLHFRIAL